MSFFCASFYYEGPKRGGTSDVSWEKEAQTLLNEINRKVEKALTDAKISWVHDHMWHDGSLFKSIRSKEPLPMVRKQLKQLFPSDSGVQLLTLTQFTPETETLHKFRAKYPTLVQTHKMKGAQK